MKCVCVAFVAVAGRRYTYTVCTYLLHECWISVSHRSGRVPCMVRLTLAGSCFLSAIAARNLPTTRACAPTDGGAAERRFDPSRSRRSIYRRGAAVVASPVFVSLVRLSGLPIWPSAADASSRLLRTSPDKRETRQNALPPRSCPRARRG